MTNTHAVNNRSYTMTHWREFDASHTPAPHGNCDIHLTEDESVIFCNTCMAACFTPTEDEIFDL